MRRTSPPLMTKAKASPGFSPSASRASLGNTTCALAPSRALRTVAAISYLLRHTVGMYDAEASRSMRNSSARRFHRSHPDGPAALSSGSRWGRVCVLSFLVLGFVLLWGVREERAKV